MSVGLHISFYVSLRLSVHVFMVVCVSICFSYELNLKDVGCMAERKMKDTALKWEASTNYDCYVLAQIFFIFSRGIRTGRVY